MSLNSPVHNERMSGMISAQRTLRSELVRDKHRPLYHIVAPEGVCRPFDPNGAIWWKGRYHLFYIFQDEHLPDGGHCWGHVSSPDLVHWRHHPTALFPAAGDPEEGIFSGCALVSAEGIATIVYLGVNSGVCIARSYDDNLDRWVKEPANPVIPIPTESDSNFGKYVVHDPHVWIENGSYYAIINGWAQWDTAYLFSSPDLVHWEYQHKFYQPRSEWTEKDEDVACPDFFPLGDRHMLLCISHKRGCRYYIGTYKDQKFVPERHARMNWDGGPCFAPESLLDPNGRRIFWAWALDRRSDKSAHESGWSGCMTLPRVISLDSGGELLIEPPQELNTLRGTLTRLENLIVKGQVTINEVSGDSLEIQLEIDLLESREVSVAVRCSPDGTECTLITYNSVSHELSIDVAKSSSDPSVKYPTLCWNPVSSWYKTETDPGSTTQRAPLHLHDGEHLLLRIYIDRSIVEVFANSRQCITHRIYPTRADAREVRIHADKSPVKVLGLTAWEMAPSNSW